MCVCVDKKTSQNLLSKDVVVFWKFVVLKFKCNTVFIYTLLTYFYYIFLFYIYLLSGELFASDNGEFEAEHFVADVKDDVRDAIVALEKILELMDENVDDASYNK